MPTRAAIDENDPPGHQALYVELLGKGGLWGLGYDILTSDRFAVGATASFLALDGEQILSLSPYLSAYPVISGKSRWLLQAGPQWVRKSIHSPVPEWSGMSSSHFGAEAGTGYEFRDRMLFRVYGMISLGGEGWVPWGGLSVGWTF